MTLAMLGKSMGRKAKNNDHVSDSGKGSDATVKFDRILAQKLKTVIDRRGGTMSQYLSDLARKQIEKDYAEVVREMNQELDQQ